MAQQDKKAPEIATIRQNTDLIIDCVTTIGSLQWFAYKLMEKNFIAYQAVPGILGIPEINQAQKVGELLDSVLTKLMSTEEKKQWFDAFVAIFSNEAAFAELVDKLKKDYEGSAYKEFKFTYTGQEDHLLQEDEYGINLHLPSHTSDAEVQCTVRLYDRNDHITFPSDCDLVSSVYQISADKEFPVKVTVQLRHCVPFDEVQAAMVFVTADSQKGPPYEFTELKGGTFCCQYGEIQLTHFCLLCILRKHYHGLSNDVTLHGIMYYYPKEATFAVVKGMPQCEKAMEKQNRDASRKRHIHIRWNRRSDIEIVVQQHTEWNVTTTQEPAKIASEDINVYDCGPTFPQIQLKPEWKGDGEPKKRDVVVTLKGVGAKSLDSFKLECAPPENTEGYTIVSKSCHVNCKGLAVIVTCNYTEDPDLRLSSPDYDAKEMEETFTKIGFHTVLIQNETCENVSSKLNDITSCLHLFKNTQGKYIFFVFSGHGSSDDKIYFQDVESLNLRDIVSDFVNEDTPTTPKLFLIDACRGTKILTNVEERSLPSGSKWKHRKTNYRIDFATIYDHKSYGDKTKGGWWLQRVSEKLRQKERSYQDIMAEVQKDVWEHRNKQQPHTEDRLHCGRLLL